MISVVAPAALPSGCHSAASTREPSIALIARKRNAAPPGAANSAGTPGGRSTTAYSILAAISARRPDAPMTVAIIATTARSQQDVMVRLRWIGPAFRGVEMTMSMTYQSLREPFGFD